MSASSPTKLFGAVAAVVVKHLSAVASSSFLNYFKCDSIELD